MFRLSILMMLFSSVVMAGQPEVIRVQLQATDVATYRIDVTLKHADTGWDHYADGWDVLDNNKYKIATRVLYHPHEEEQPFTRSLSGVKISADTDVIYIRGHDKVHGYGELYKVEMKQVLSD